MLCEYAKLCDGQQLLHSLCCVNMQNYSVHCKMKRNDIPAVVFFHKITFMKENFC